MNKKQLEDAFSALEEYRNKKNAEAVAYFLLFFHYVPTR